MMEVVKHAEILANFTWINISVKLRDAQNLLQLLCSAEIFVSKWAPVCACSVTLNHSITAWSLNASVATATAQPGETEPASETARLGFSEALQTYTSRWWKSELQAFRIAPRAFHFLSCHKLSCKDVLSKCTFWFCNASYLWLAQQHVADRAGKTKGIL